MTVDKPFAPACDRNREPILAVLRTLLADRRSVLEVGSGTGQHAVHFAATLRHLRWQTSDVRANLPGICLWLADAALPNTPAPIFLDVAGTWPEAQHDAVYTANTLHIMGWLEVQTFFERVASVLTPGGLVIVYGPFKYLGEYTSASNAAFDVSLRAADPQRGVREFELVDALARAAGLNLVEDRAMPANNRCITWQRAQVGD
jgi:cyclopropane fatty-acyl-phospholipid synthase-like methyltransferase